MAQPGVDARAVADSASQTLEEQFYTDAVQGLFFLWPDPVPERLKSHIDNICSRLFVSSARPKTSFWLRHRRRKFMIAHPLNKNIPNKFGEHQLSIEPFGPSFFHLQILTDNGSNLNRLPNSIKKQVDVCGIMNICLHNK